MAITARYAIVCDDVRREDNGKLLFLGVYTPDMAVPQIPFAMPTLTFLLNLEAERPGNFGFRMRVQHQDSGAILAEGMGMIPVGNPQQPVIIPVKLGGVVFNAQGLYSFSMEIDGNTSPIVATFNVLLAPQGQLNRG
jgi:hypothetical protein